MAMNTTTLKVDVAYDPEKTDPETLASAMDRLLETALSTPGIMDEYANPHFREFSVLDPAIRPASRLVVTVEGGVV